MPANLPPQYFEAEKAYKAASTPEQKIEALEAMLAIMPHHKGTDKLRAELRARIARYSSEAQRRPSTGKRGNIYDIKKEGAGQVVVVGLPNSGKSQLVSALSGATLEISDYPFTTKSPTPAMMRFQNVQIELVDLPPVTDREARPWLPRLLKNADAMLIVVDLSNDPLGQMEIVLRELQEMKVRPLGNSVMPETAIGVVQKKASIIANKADVPGAGDNYQKLNSAYGDDFSVIAISAREGKNLDAAKSGIFEVLEVIRVYTRPPGKKPDFDGPTVLKKGSAIGDFAGSIHKDFRVKLRYAQVWGSGKFEGQRVGKDHVLADGDVVELHV
ncbi:MAG: TGS domain-containing protein [Chloroflexi bacterium]|nr:TGS domain-containing protein [Chloroflexota bacterium]